MNRRLYRCNHDRRLAGVAAGLAEYLDIDVTLVRVIWVVSIFFGGFGLLLYLLMALVVPSEPEGYAATDPLTPEGVTGTTAAPGAYPAPHRHANPRGRGIGLDFIGIVLILCGALAMVDNLAPGWADRGRFLGPAFILSIGVVLIVMATRRRSQAL